MQQQPQLLGSEIGFLWSERRFVCLREHETNLSHKCSDANALSVKICRLAVPRNPRLTTGIAWEPLTTIEGPVATSQPMRSRLWFTMFHAFRAGWRHAREG